MASEGTPAGSGTVTECPGAMKWFGRESYRRVDEMGTKRPMFVAPLGANAPTTSTNTYEGTDV